MTNTEVQNRFNETHEELGSRNVDSKHSIIDKENKKRNR